MPSDAGSDDDAVFEVVRKVVDEQRSKMAERAATGIEPMAAVERGEVLRFMSFGSGSSGNCAYLGTRSCGVLIDAGVDPKVVLDALHRCGIDVATIAGIILTPVGMILGSILGAFIAELTYGNKTAPEALKSSLGAFVGFMLGSGLKLIVSGAMLWAIIVYAF